MLFLANIAGFLVANWRRIAVGLGIIAVLIVTIWAYRACGRRSAKLNQKQIVEAQQAIAKQDRVEMERVLAESDADEAVADGVVTDAAATREAAIVESKKKAVAMSNDELAAELERRTKE